MPNIAIFAPNSSGTIAHISYCLSTIDDGFHLALSPALQLSDGLSFLLHRVVKFRLKTVRLNLELSFPELSVQNESDRKKFLSTPLRCVLEMAKTAISEKEIKKRFVFKNMELINAHEKRTKHHCFLVIF